MTQTIPLSAVQRSSLTYLADQVARAVDRRDHYLAAILEGAGIVAHQGTQLTADGLVVTLPDPPEPAAGGE